MHHQTPSDTPSDAAWSKASLLAQAMGRIDEATRAVTPPIHVTTTFIRDPDNQYRSGNVYGRPDNETVREVEAVLSMLEGGAGAMAFGSGMSAATAVLLALQPGDHVVAPTVMYWALRNWLKNDYAAWGVAVDFVDTSDLDALRGAVKPGRTRLVWIETPSNPMWSVTDIAGAAAIAHAAGARLAVDSTVATPILSQPLALGADVVMHSATKYLNGHSDVIGGAVVAADPVEVEALRHWGNVVGSTGAPFDAWLTLRGLRTLFPRMERQQINAMAVAQYLEHHSAVSIVHYPGLSSHPGHAIASRQQRGFGAMLSFELAGGTEAVKRFIAAVDCFTLAESLGGVESLVVHPATMTHADMGVEARALAGISDSLLRLSVGIEAEQDLIAGLERGLDACAV